MRTDEDIVRISMTLCASISIDWERVEADPAWIVSSQEFDLDIPEQRIEALKRYIGNYMGQQLILTHCPATNGPGEPFILDMEVINDDSSSTSGGNTT